MKVARALMLSVLLASAAAVDCQTASAQPPSEVSPRERSLRQLRVALDDCQGNARSLRERMRKNEYADIAEHADELYKLAQDARKTAIEIPGAEGELLMRDMADLQHATDEVRDAAKKKNHDGVHHGMEVIDETLTKFERDLKQLGG